MTFKLTYSTMFNPPDEMHERFEEALAEVRSRLGATYALHIRGRDVTAARTYATHSPIDQSLLLGRFPLGDVAEVDQAMAAARLAFDGWRTTPMTDRLALVRRAAALIEERVYDIGAAISLEVGKNRMESLGETQETADFFRGYADEFERNHGFDHAMPDDPLPDYCSHNRSVLKPYGVWAVITPFNYPLALAGGPVASAGRGLPAGRVQLPERPGLGCRRGDHQSRRPGRHHCHRFGGSGHEDLPPDGRGSLAAPVHRRDGREERLRCHGTW
jgi:delta 1-pyrroline-5-carboxylate dehydrogenase